jgi:predicted metal-binding membrane protein
MASDVATTAAAAPPRSAWRGRAPVVVAIAVAWALAIVAEATGNGTKLHHDALIHGTLPKWEALLLFLVAWQAMIAAMMLPSSLPMVRLFSKTSASQAHRGRVMASFLSGYALVWTVFGAVAFVGDLFLHRFADHNAYLSAHRNYIAGGVILLAGVFQFSSLKEKCLQECRHPGVFLMRRYRRGEAAALKIGAGHGVFCLGCCWALMLLMFAAGVANLWWMAGLTALMVYEKTGAGGRRAVPVAGITLLACAALVLAHPHGLPALLGGGH